MPRPAQIPDLERQVGNLIGRVETLERKRPEVTRPEPDTGGAAFPAEAHGFCQLEPTGTDEGYGLTVLPADGTLLHIEWALEAGVTQEQEPWTPVGGSTYGLEASAYGGWIHTVVNFSFFPNVASTLTGGLAYTSEMVTVDADHAAGHLVWTAAVAGIGWGGTFNSFTKWGASFSPFLPLTVRLYGTGTATCETSMSVFGTRVYASEWPTA